MQFSTFIDSSPTAWHACANIAKMLERQGFERLDEKESWKIQAGSSYFVTRNESSLLAFIVPKMKMQKVISLAAHTDSPGLKLKPCAEFVLEGCSMLHFEIYGAPILASWLGKDLYLAGRVFYRHNDKIDSKLIELSEHPFIIPNLAFHLDRQVNDNGLLVHKQDHLAALVSADAKPYLEPLVKKKIRGELLHHELFAVPCEKSRLIGKNHDLLAAARLDNLAHTASSVEALLSQKPHASTLKMVALFNFEEIGSMTQEGAASSFFTDVLGRLSDLAGLKKEEYLCLKARSRTISCDVGHAVHPNHADRHDSRHLTKLGLGPIVKTNAQCKYVTDAETAALIMLHWSKNNIPYQFFSFRNDIPCGSTIGPIHAARTGFKTIDMGIPLLGMHASREVIHKGDYEAFVKGLEIIFETL